MIKLISKYYLRFPPMARTAVNLSITGLFGYVGVDFHNHLNDSTILLACDEATNKLFV